MKDGRMRNSRTHSGDTSLCTSTLFNMSPRHDCNCTTHTFNSLCFSVYLTADMYVLIGCLKINPQRVCAIRVCVCVSLQFFVTPF